MTSVPLDPEGEASRALATAVEDFGPRALSNPVVLANLFKDLLPDSPRETNVLVTAAEAGLAKAITERVDQGLPADAATHQAATMVADARAMDPAAAHWAARQFATVLGYDVPATPLEPGVGGGAGAAAAAGIAGAGIAGTAAGWPGPVEDPRGPEATSPWGTPPAWPQPAGGGGFTPPGNGGPNPPPATVPGVSASGGAPPPITSQPTEVVGPATSGWGSTGWGSDAAQPPGGGYGTVPGYGTNPAPGTNPTSGATTPTPAYGAAAPAAWGSTGPATGGAPWTPTPAPGPRKSRTPWYLGAAAVAAVIAAVVVVLVVSGGGSTAHSGTTVAGGSSTTASPGTTGIGSSTTGGTVAPTTAPTTATTTTIASGLTPAEQALATLLPSDSDPSVDCSTQQNLPSGLTHLRAALGCDGPTATDPNDPGLPGGEVFAYQFDNPTDYQAGLVQYNKDKAFTPSTAGKACPPATTNDDGLSTWTNPAKTLSGQLECFSASNNNSQTNTQPVYIWTVPSRNTIIEAVGATNWSFTKLNTWFAHWGIPR